MSRIEDMIKELCPEGVERVKLGEVCEIKKGIQFNKADMLDDGLFPVINGGILPSGYINESNECSNTITISQGGASAGFVNFITSDFWLGAHCYSLKPKGVILNRYLYHLTKLSENYFMQCQYGAGIPALNKKTVESLEIPLPPLPIQEEIVRILDKHTDLIKNIDEEIALRQQQFEFYINKLLTFSKEDNRVEWKKLADIGTMFKGKGILRSDFVEDGMPCIHYGQVHTYYGFSAENTKSFVSKEMYANSSKAKKGDLIIATTSEDVEACCKSTVWLGDSEPAISGDAHFFRHNQEPRYMGYLFRTELFAAQKRTAAVGAKATRVHGDSILKFAFPIPSIEYQKDVVEKLDKFDVLIYNLKQERNLRLKQYEYYREQLLNF